MRFIKYVRICLILSLAVCLSCSEKRDSGDRPHARTDEMAMVLLKARSLPERVATLSATYGDFTIPQAYLVQARLAEHLAKIWGSVQGYKIGFTAKSEWAEFGINEPAHGLIFHEQMISNGDTLHAKNFFTFIIEAEIAFRIGRVVEVPVNAREEAAKFVESVHASFDISDNWYDAGKGAVKVVDFIANSGGSRHYALGPPVNVQQWDLNNITLTLYRDGEIVYAGHSSAVMDSPWNALIWLANHELERGSPLQPGCVVLTGKVAPYYRAQGDAAKGAYTADCGPLGKITVIVN